MTDDIVTRLTTQEMTTAFHKAFPTVVTLEDAMRQALEAADEIERLETEILEINLLWNADKAEIERLRTELETNQMTVRALHNLIGEKQ